VLIDGRVPRVCSLKEVLRAFLDHRRDVLRRRSRHRLEKIDARLEILEGFIIAFLNLDRVIDIIRYDADPKRALIAESWGVPHPRALSEKDYVPPPVRGEDAEGELTEAQAEAILNMRLRSLRKLEEIEITRENKALSEEARELNALIASPERQTARLAADLSALRTAYGPTSALGRRRTSITAAPQVRDVPIEAMIEKEPITVICSAKGWIRAMKGHSDLASAEALKFKEGDGPAWAFHAQTTDRLVLAASDGRFYTLMPDRLPGGRGLGEPVRLMIDLAEGTDIVALFTHKPDGRLLLAASDGRGFQVEAGELLAETRKGRQVMSPRAGAALKVVRWIDAADDMVAVIGENRKLLVFPITELPQLQKGQGVALQKYKDGGMADARTFVMADGLTWPMGGDSGRVRTESDLTFWKGARASAGRMPPTGFPRDNKFTP
jgi:topoisomerase-4 subunit A